MAACIVQRARARSGQVVPARKHYFGCVQRHRAYEACAQTRPKPMAEALRSAARSSPRRLRPVSTLDQSPESSYASANEETGPSLARLSSSRKGVSARRWHAKRAIYDTLVAGTIY